MAELQELLPFTKKLSLLFVDPQDELRTPLCGALKKIFSLVDEATDGYDALNQYKINQYDIVIIDGTVPGMTAMQLVKNIKSVKAGQQIIYTVPAQPKPEEMSLLLNMGLSGFIVKPYNVESLLDTLSESVQVSYNRMQQQELIDRYKTTKGQHEKLLEDAKVTEQKLKDELMYERKRLGRLMQSQKELQKNIDTYEDKIGSIRNVNELTGAASKHALQEALKQEGPKALLYLNIDNFDIINSIFGMGQGNKVLLESVKRLENFLPNNARLFHITADEFVILINNPVASQESLLAEQVLALFKEAPIEVDGNKYNILFSIGVDRGEGAGLFVHAIDASKEAKAHGGGCIRYYKSDSDYIVSQRHNLYWINLVRTAIDENRLTAYYQPIISNVDNTVQHYEVLCRIIDENNQVVSAERFIKAAVLAGLSTQISRIVIDKAFKHFSGNDYRFSININKSDLEEDYLESFLTYKCDRYNIEPERVYLELVEDSSMDSARNMVRQIEKLRALGFHIAVDDFGTEHSMLSRMLQFQADFIKIDSTFIKDLNSNPFHRLVVENIVQFAKKAGMKTVAEHVDSEEIHQIVHDLGVNFSQGYYIGKPVAGTKQGQTGQNA
ncbi:MAG: EAL domain-containing protein [Sulfurimonadaceae bacterium]|nr:EAL domain-containing protein [Sulfurimonadaceae bacterium]